MKFILLFFLTASINSIVFSQNTLKINVKDSDTGEPLSGTNIFLLETQNGASTDQEGYAEISDIPDGSYRVKLSYIGYQEKEITIVFPPAVQEFEIDLDHEAEELEEIYVSSTRSSRLISSTPTRIEVIAGEEIDEKITMDPSNISMMLNESTGIQVQQSSPVSANSSFLIQGLEGRYTQLLQDGFPLYSGFSGSLSILQIPPLNLKQVEIVKGSSSTLFGGGAIAGLINLITKTPDPEGELSFLVNGSTAGGADLSGYYSKDFGKAGITLLISRNSQKIYDNNNDNFSDLPRIERYSVSPGFFFVIDSINMLEIGGSFISEEREGGYIPLDINIYRELNKTRRFSTRVKYDRIINDKSKLTLRNSIGYFNRDLAIPQFEFSGRQVSTFSEAVYIAAGKNFDWIIGANLVSEDFRRLSRDSAAGDYTDITAGIFAQSVYDFSDIHSLESGLRIDYADDYDYYILPRLSFMSRWSHNVTTRIGGGLGYKLPTLFTEDSEEIYFRNLLPLNKAELNAEKSYGLNFDINYNSILFNFAAVSFNNLFFYTRIHDPLILTYNNLLNSYEFTSYDGFYHTAGMETNIKISVDHLKLFTGYTYTAVTSPAGSELEYPLTPRHRLGIVLIYEKHEDYRIGLEAYFTGEQKLSSGETGRSHWINGLMIEKHFEQFSIYVNFENFLDVRQSKFGPMYSGTPSDPQFEEIYAPTDGRIFNAGVKIRL